MKLIAIRLVRARSSTAMYSFTVWISFMPIATLMLGNPFSLNVFESLPPPLTRSEG